MGEFDKVDKKESPEHVGDPNKLKGKDAPASVAIAQRHAPDGAKSMGVGCTELIDGCPTFNKAECEYEISYKNLNCSIILGRDRPGDKLSGYGGAGVKRSHSIDIVAGRMGPEAASVNSKNEILFCENNFSMDAARIHVSQRTNIDHNFRIRSVVNKPSKNCSGIGIKADSVRLIGRKDVRIVTGTDFYDSHGKVVGVDYKVPCKISLVGDNRDDLLQPMVKGNSLQALLIEMNEVMHHILSTIDVIILHQNMINFAVVNHTHRDRLDVNSFGFPSEDLLFQAYQPAIKLVTDAKASLLEIAGMIESTKAEYILLPEDGSANKSNILSNYNFCN